MSGLIPRRGPVTGEVDLAATYDPVTEILKLSANGLIGCVAYAFEFERRIMLGGYAYDLTAYQGPVLPPPPHRWEHEQHFRVPNLPPHFPAPRSVTVYTGEHPEGQRVDVRWLGVRPPPSAVNADADLSKLVVERHTIAIFYGESTTISPPVDLKRTWPVFDSSHLALTGATITDEKLNLTFKPLRVGITEVVVSLGEVGPAAESAHKIIYEIITIGDGPGPVRPPEGKGVSAVNGSTSDTGALPFLNFLDGINMARVKVHKHFPDARLFTIDCHQGWGHLWPVSSAYELGHLTVKFRAKRGHVVIRSRGTWFDWEEPIYFFQPILGPRDLPWPIPNDMGLEGAVDLLLAASAPKKFVSAQLVNPNYAIGKHPWQPWYIFEMAGGSSWAVGTVDKKVIQWSGESDEPIATDPPVSTQQPAALADDAASVQQQQQQQQPLPPVGIAASVPAAPPAALPPVGVAA